MGGYGFTSWVEAGILLCCSIHDAANAKWLVEQGREMRIPKDKVGAYLCQEDKDQSCLLAGLDGDLQQQVAFWNPEATAEISPKLNLDFIQWLITQAREDKWPKAEVASIVWRRNKEGTLIISQLGFETHVQVALWRQTRKLTF